MIHPDDASALGIADGDAVVLGNVRGETTLTAKYFDGLRRGVLIAESIQPNKAHIGGRGINTLTGAEAVAPIGGAAPSPVSEPAVRIERGSGATQGIGWVVLNRPAPLRPA